MYRENLSASADEPVVVCIAFSIRPMLCQIEITYINFKAFEEYLRELECGQTDRQTEFQLCWKMLKILQFYM